MARILLGVSGGIAAYKACEVCRLLVKGGHEVVPLVTPAAERFVTKQTFNALARRPPGDDVYLHLTRADALTLGSRGVVFVGPDEGETAEGELGVGRMAEPMEIVQALVELLA